MNPELDIGQSATLTDIATCINHYRFSTPGLYVCVHAPVQLDSKTRIVPGVIAQVNYGIHKQCNAGSNGCFSGPPNFVFDVFKDNEKEEYTFRRECFERHGVREYVAWIGSSSLPIWNRLVDGAYETIQDDGGGMLKSVALPGLWIPIEALKNRDWWAILAAISEGVTRKEHHDFMATIWNK